MSKQKQAFAWSIWGWPIALAVISIVGLLSALLDDGAWDAVSWFALGLPVAVCLWFGLPVRWVRRGPGSDAAHTPPPGG